MAQCSVTVTTSISGLSVSPTSKTLNVGEKLDLSNSVTKTPSTAREGITWTSSNSSIASVSQTGVITANSTGTATITVKSSSGNRSATCTITVIKKYSSSEINSSFYGSLVTNYHGPNDGGIKYRIFYADGTNVYLIADDYIHYNKVPKGTRWHDDYNGHEVAEDYNFRYGNTGYNIMLDFNDSYTNGEPASPLNASYEYMEKTSKWNPFYKGDFADYAMGGPSLNMYISSYNQTHNTNIIYRFVADNTYGTAYYLTDKDGVLDYSLPKKEDFNGIYLKLSTSKATGMWFSTYGTSYKYYSVYTAGYYGNNKIGLCATDITKEYKGFRPIVRLNSKVIFNKNAGDGYTISY